MRLGEGVGEKRGEIDVLTPDYPLLHVAIQWAGQTKGRSGSFPQLGAGLHGGRDSAVGAGKRGDGSLHGFMHCGLNGGQLGGGEHGIGLALKNIVQGRRSVGGGSWVFLRRGRVLVFGGRSDRGRASCSTERPPFRDVARVGGAGNTRGRSWGHGRGGLQCADELLAGPAEWEIKGLQSEAEHLRRDLRN